MGKPSKPPVREDWFSLVRELGKAVVQVLGYVAVAWINKRW